MEVKKNKKWRNILLWLLLIVIFLCTALFGIRDSGHGISEADMPHIFEPFFSTKGPSKGTGLGLAICQQIAETHGGQITAESKPGQGSCFTLELPEAVEPIDGNK